MSAYIACCRSCGMERDCRLEIAGPICAECAPDLGAPLRCNALSAPKAATLANVKKCRAFMRQIGKVLDRHAIAGNDATWGHVADTGKAADDLGTLAKFLR